MPIEDNVVCHVRSIHIHFSAIGHLGIEICHFRKKSMNTCLKQQSCTKFHLYQHLFHDIWIFFPVDGVILHAVEDTDMVKEFVNNMEKEFQHLKLKLRLFEELAIPGRGCFASTEKVFETCRYLFVFMTKNFEKAKMENFLHNILLRETIMEDEKNERLIPVQVDPEVEISILATTNPLKYNSYLARKGDESYCKIFKNIITHGRNNFLTM